MRNVPVLYQCFLLLLASCAVQAHSSSSINATTTSGTILNEHLPVDTDIDCNESPPPCGVTHERYDGFPYAFTMAGQGYVNYILHVLDINSSLPVCSLDPFQEVAEVINGTSSFEINFHIRCIGGPTRIVIHPSQNLTLPLTFSYVFVGGCSIFWKDLSVLGQHLDVRVLVLYAWEDEFDQDKAGYFQHCVALDSTHGEGNDTDVFPPVSGLANVGSLDIAHKDVRPVSRVFTHHLWPKMAEVSFRGYVRVRVRKLYLQSVQWKTIK